MKSGLEYNVRIPKHVLMTVKRPNGKIEQVEAQPCGFKVIDDKMFNQLVEATKKSGRGDLLSYENIYETKEGEIEWTEADLAGMASDLQEKEMKCGE